MMLCPCGSHQTILQCCRPYIDGACLPQTPEALMRSRYTAYSEANIDYIIKTMRDQALLGFDQDSAYRWAKRTNWIHLNVLATHQVDPEHGTVEFEAIFMEGKTLHSIHEKSEFIRIANVWYYTAGHQLPALHPMVNTLIGRNTLCPCGSKKKFKHCHG